MRNILDLEYEKLNDVIISYGEKAFRTKQVFKWLSQSVGSFDQMSNVPASLRRRLGQDFYIGMPEVVREQRSGEDGTCKCLFSFSGDALIESVFMKYEYGNSICISSQSGCRMGCKFCASTINGLQRSLTRGEMLAQVLQMRNVTGEEIGHVVVMGMGEPFDNYDELAGFIRLINDQRGYGLGMRNITVSTCGLIPMIERFAEDFPQVNLAVSLHAPNDETRRKTMPIARKYSFDELMRACRNYTEKTHRRITFEYALIEGVNASHKDAEELAKQLRGWLTHVNLIPLNKVEETGLERASQDSVKQFKEILEKSGVAVTIRRTLGSDIDAACGQLRNRDRREQGLK